jgi:cobalt-zinc-cadmium efflux system protein
MAHGHIHHVEQAATQPRGRLAAAVCLSATYMAAEAIGGWLSHSLSLLADAGHMLSDTAALGLSLFAVWIATQPATAQRTFGYHRAEILAALVNATTLIAMAGLILFEAWDRWRKPHEIHTGVMLGVALGGLAVNLAMLGVLHAGRHGNLNVRGAWLHVLGDTLGSAAVITAAIGLRVWHWTWLDPAASAAISLLIVYSSWSLLRETVHVLMEGAPASISVDDVRECLLAAPGVSGVHCLHVWTITSGLNSLSAHVVVDRDRVGAAQLSELRHAVQHRFPVGHVTLQIEPEGFAACPDEEGGQCQIRRASGAASDSGSTPLLN